MIQLVYSPQWFYGKDIIIDIISIIVLFLIGFFSIRSYKIKKNRNYLFLATSFFMISISFIFKIMTNFTIYYKVLETHTLPFGTLTYQALKSTDVLFLIGYLAYRLLTLVGLYILYLIYEKRPYSKANVLLVIYLLIVSTYFSRAAYYIFHLTAFLLLLLITYQYFMHYKEHKQTATKTLAISFAIITAGNLFSCFIEMEPAIYAIAEIIQLIGYILLLITFIIVLKHGKKKKQN